MSQWQGSTPDPVSGQPLGLEDVPPPVPDTVTPEVSETPVDSPFASPMSAAPAVEGSVPPPQFPNAVPVGYTPGAPGYATSPRQPKGLRAGPVIAIAVILALLAGIVGGAVGFAFANRVFTNDGVNPSISLGTAPAAGTSDRPADSIAGVAAKVLPTVVSLDVVGPSQAGSGSGFIIRSDGYILTNNHVIEAAASQGTVTAGFNDGTKATATIVGRDPAYDLAVIKVDKKDLPALPLGNSDDLVVGDAVLAVGSPLGLTGTVTTGIVSALNRPVTAGGSGTNDTSFINAIQTDAAINPGNSGGPLVNSAGSAIGINSAIATLGGASSASGSIGVGFAIPINQARRTAEEIIKTGKSTKPVIGVTLDVRYAGPGAKIAENSIGGGQPITPGGAADKAGLKPGDVVLAVDGRTINTADELIVAIRASQPGDTVTLKVQRGGSTQEFKVVLGSQSTTE